MGNDLRKRLEFGIKLKKKCLKPGYPEDKIIYLLYTDQKIKCNPSITPTSIIIKKQDLALDIFGFVPKFVDFDVKLLIKTKREGYYEFRPTYQVITPW